jgi:hypothetical protein
MDDWPALSAALVAVIRAALPEAIEEVKWNAPSFSLGGRHMITLMRPRGGGARVVLHRGAKAVDTRTGKRLLDVVDPRLTWATDQRAQAAFTSCAEVDAGADWLAALCRDWVAVATRD